ncbi:MAG: MFS transporter [Acidaminobacteraceae bacterium]
MKLSTKQMIFMRTIYSIFKSFVLIFINIYLWQSGKSIDAVAIFNICNYLGATISFYLANVIALKNSKFNYLLSSLSFIALFALTAIFKSSIAEYAVLIGFLGGFGDGFFFFNQNTFQADKLDKEELDQFMSVMGAISKATSIVTPVVSGIIIQKFGFMTMVYTLLVLVVVQFINGLFMPNDHIESLGKINIRKILKNKKTRRVFLTHTIRAPYSQFSIVSSSVFLYAFAKSEYLMGALNSTFAITSMTLFYIYRYAQRFRKKKDLMLVGAIAHSLAVLLLLKPTFISFVIYNVAISIGGAFFGTPTTGIQLYSAKKYSEDQAEMLGNLFVRVIMLTIGRIIFYLLLLLFYRDFSSPIFYIIVIYNFIIPLVSYRFVMDEV